MTLTNDRKLVINTAMPMVHEVHIMAMVGNKYYGSPLLTFKQKCPLIQKNETKASVVNLKIPSESGKYTSIGKIDQLFVLPSFIPSDCGL